MVAAAEKLGVRDELARQWSRHGSTYAQEVINRVVGVTAKAWRFRGEMEEIAATFKTAGVPDGFHLAAAELYRRISKFKGADALPAVGEVIKALLSDTAE